MLMYYHENAGKNHNIKIANRPFENVVKFKYFETTVTNQNLNRKEIKIKLNLGNVCYQSVQFRHFCLLICCLGT
jgi:hypothetical protein